MENKGHMNFFYVSECGLYKAGDNSTSYGYSLDETFELISEWAKGRTLASTIPWDPETKNNKSKCYCKDIHKDSNTGDYFMVLWKSDTDAAGTLLGATEDDQTGTGKVIEYTNSHKGDKVIWGRPCYYWVIPKLNIVVSIKFEHSVCDSELFQDYVSSCIRNKVSHKNRKKRETDKGFVRITLENDDNQECSYRFNMGLMSINTSTAAMQELVSKVTGIVTRETIPVNTQDERAGWLKIFNKMPFVPYNNSNKSKRRKVEIFAEITPTEKDLQEVIRKYAKENRNKNDWDNVGFKTKETTIWVDAYRLTETVHIEGAQKTVFLAQDICNQVASNRNRYLAAVKRDQEKNPLKYTTAA